MRPSSIAWILCGIAVLALAAMWSVKPQPLADDNVAGVTLGGAFTLTDHNGNRVTEHQWPGQYLLVYFGFTHCPDICPTGLSKITEALNALPPETAAKIQPLLITVDPARDDVNTLKTYVALFHPRLVGLTGSQAEIEHVKKLWRVYAEKQGNDKDYMVNHSGFSYLMNPDGSTAAIFAHETTPEEMTEKIKKAVK